MKKLIFLAVTFNLLTSCSNSQPSNNSKNLKKGNISSEIISLLPKGEVIVDIMDSVKTDDRYKELNKKFTETAQKNREWFMDYVKSIPDGEPMPYHPNLGLTEIEYHELLAYINNMIIIPSEKKKVNIKNSGDIIEFKSDGKLAVLDLVKINLAQNTVNVGDYALTFSDTVNVTSDKNPLGSAWKGYKWVFSDPKDINFSSKDLKTLKIKIYEFTLGKRKKDGKTLLVIKGQEVENGFNKINFEIPVIF